MRIAIVNDLALAQAVLRRLVESVPGYRVAWTAADGAEAVRKCAADVPDAILMDLVMPMLDGAEATRRIMATTPCPILIVTASVGANYGKVYEALGAGGLDAVKTPTIAGQTLQGAQPILDRLTLLAQAKSLKSSPHPFPSPPGGEGQGVRGVAVKPTRPPPRAEFVDTQLPCLLAIGASTGGPDALVQVLAALAPAPPGPVVIVQHIAADFAAGFAQWLHSRTRLPVSVARPGDTPKIGNIYVAGTNDHLALRPNRQFAYTVDPQSYPYRPSVDVFFDSLTGNWPRPGIAVLLTGMGSDGAQGLANVKRLGWHTITQDKESCVVYGMPRAAAEANAAVEILPLSRIGSAIIRRFRA